MLRHHEYVAKRCWAGATLLDRRLQDPTERTTAQHAQQPVCSAPSALGTLLGPADAYKHTTGSAAYSQAARGSALWQEATCRASRQFPLLSNHLPVKVDGLHVLLAVRWDRGCTDSGVSGRVAVRMMRWRPTTLLGMHACSLRPQPWLLISPNFRVSSLKYSCTVKVSSARLEVIACYPISEEGQGSAEPGMCIPCYRPGTWRRVAGTSSCRSWA